MTIVSTLLAASGIGGTPDPNGLPGSSALQSLDLGPRVLGAARLPRRSPDLSRSLGALLSLRELPALGARSAGHGHLCCRGVHRRGSAGDHQLLREPRHDGPLTVPVRDVSFDGVPRPRPRRGRRARDSGARPARDRRRDRQPYRRAARIVGCAGHRDRTVVGVGTSTAGSRSRQRRHGAVPSPPQRTPSLLSTATFCSTRAGSLGRRSDRLSRVARTADGRLRAGERRDALQARCRNRPGAGDRASIRPGRLSAGALLPQAKRRSRSGTWASSEAARRSSRSSRGGRRSSRSSGRAARGRSAPSGAPTGPTPPLSTAEIASRPGSAVRCHPSL